MRNIELKVKVLSLEAVRVLLEGSEATKEGLLHQVDTYFNTSSGRFKLRIINNESANLVYYERPDQGESKLSHYELLVLDAAKGKQLSQILVKTKGVLVEVEKQRELWLWKHTRVHLDAVKGLGEYLELETVVDGISLTAAEVEHRQVIALLGLEQYEKCEGSYSDLLMRS